MSRSVNADEGCGVNERANKSMYTHTHPAQDAKAAARYTQKQKFFQVLSMVSLYSKYTKALTSENF